MLKSLELIELRTIEGRGDRGVDQGGGSEGGDDGMEEALEYVLIISQTPVHLHTLLDLGKEILKFSSSFHLSIQTHHHKLINE